MKNQIKKFSQYINEVDDFGMHHQFRRRDPGRGIAVMTARFAMGVNDVLIEFGENFTTVEDNEDGNDWEEVFDAAAELGASSDIIFSVDDDGLLFRDEPR